MKKVLKIICVIIMIILLINVYMILTVSNKITDLDNQKLKEADCILILGAGIVNNRPSPMLEDRLLTGFELYDNKISTRILVSGDHINNDYNEVKVMKNYLIEKGIPSEIIFMDHAGISSYDSIYRAKEIYKAKKVVIVTQKYHLYRALYIAKTLNIEAYGVIADKNIYNNQIKRDIREIFARVKDFFKCINKPQSTYLGEVYPISGNGNKTNDKHIN